MKLNFTKMHGCGNDYIYFNCFEQEIADPAALAVRLSDRHFGVGGDGVILICPSETADAKMRMFNADGSEGKMCGNGVRCVGKYVYDSGIAAKPEVAIETLSGIKILRMKVEDGIAVGATVNMGAAVLNPAEIPARFDGDTAVSVPLTVGGRDYSVTCVSMGNPHCVVFVDADVNTLDLPKIGPSFERHEAFPEQVNTEFIRVIDDHTLQMRVWERGSGETLACGTGACAAAVAAVLNGFCPKGEDITIHLLGGDLTIRYTDEAVFLTGPAATVFEGSVDA
ncbi:MAG TPA: diaminopimelate epimerase [Ruminococcus sp.]|nr:diaminopimelate epimerase [Ruminococcus sp.]